MSLKNNKDNQDNNEESNFRPQLEALLQSLTSILDNLDENDAENEEPLESRDVHDPGEGFETDSLYDRMNQMMELAIQQATSTQEVELEEEVEPEVEAPEEVIFEEIPNEVEAEQVDEVEEVFERASSEVIEEAPQEVSEEETEITEEETEDLTEYGEEPILPSDSGPDLHQYFLDSTINKTFTNALADKEFFEHFKDDMLADYNNIFKYEKNLRQMTKKPYYLLHSEKDLYVGRETFGNVWYMCFRNLMMVDVDLGDDKEDLSEAVIADYKQFLQEYCDLPENADKLFMLFRSKRGIHNFLVSHKKEFNDLESLKTMLELKGDAFHSSFSFLRGYCCRLNKKNKNDLDNVYDFIGYVGGSNNPKPLKSLMRQVMLHLDVIPYFEGHFCEGTTKLLLKKTGSEETSHIN